MDHDQSAPPPPAYSEQVEFDQKISTAREVSLTIADTPSRVNEEEEWEEWDEAGFAAAARAMAASSNKAQMARGGSPSSQNVGSTMRSLPACPPEQDGHGRPNYMEPLHIHKKTEANSSAGASGSSKQRPSWYAEAGLAGPSSSSSPEAGPSSYLPHARSSSDTPASSPSTSQPVRHDIPADDDEDRSIPPPPFAAVGPSLDGPQYEEIVTLAYHGSGSNPPSPLASPIPVNTLLPLSFPIPSRSPSPEPQNQPLHAHTPEPSIQHHPQPPSLSPLSPSSTHRMGPRPTTSFTSSIRSMQPSEIPHMDFNPSVAYIKRGGLQDFHRAQQPLHSVDATAFYNSVVSAHLPGPSKVMQAHRPYSMNPPNHGPQSTYYPQQPAFNPGTYPSPSDGTAANQGARYPPVSPVPTYLIPPLPHAPSANNPRFASYPLQVPAVSTYPTIPQHQPAVPNTFQFTQYPGLTSDVRQNRWATSEEQITGSFR